MIKDKLIALKNASSGLVALVAWCAFMPGQTSWGGMWAGWLLIVWVGWLIAASEGTIKKIPLPAALLVGWAGFMLWVTAQKFLIETGGIPALVCIPVICIASAVAAVQWIGSWNRDQTKWALTCMQFSLGVMVLYGWLQFFGLDQFQRDARNICIVGGTIGNESLFAAYLAIHLPLWTMGSVKHWKLLGLISTLGLIVVTQSASGLGAAIAVLVWLAIFQRLWRAKLIGLLLILFLGVAVLLATYNLHAGFFDLHGRLEVWAALLSFWRENGSITGMGLGSMWGLAERWPEGHILAGWHHAHNEYLQTLFALGIIGYISFVWMHIDCGVRLFKISVEDKALYGGMLLASVLCAFTSFTWHLTLTACSTLMAYARVVARSDTKLTREG